jgi:hypothetical protein
MCRSYEKLLLNCTINLLTIFLYNIDKKQREYGYNEKIKLPIKNIETNIILNALIQFKNDKLKQGIYTEPIDELILKLNKIY